MWLREHGHVFDWGTLRWCQMYDTRAQRLLRRRDDRARRVRSRRGPRPSREPRRRLATTSTPSSRRSRGRSRRSAGTSTSWVAATSPRSSASTTCRHRRRSSRPAWTSTRPSSLTASATAVDPLRRRVNLHRHASRSASNSALRSPGRQRRVGPDRDAPAARRRGRTTWSSVATMATRSRDRDLRRATAVTSRRREYRALFAAPSNEGLNGDRQPRGPSVSLPCTGAPCALAERR